MTGGMTRTKAKRTRRAPAPPPAPAPVTLPPVLLWNNWSLRRAGLKGFRVEVSFDGEALCLAGRRRRDPGFVRLVEAIVGAVAGAGRMDRIETGQRMVDALVMPFFAVVIFGLMIYGLWFEPEYSTPRTPELATARLWITGLGLFLLVLAFREFFRVTRPRRIGQLSDLYAYLPGW